ncbi:MAG: Crp/Fnr family transcriptional regulator [Clostridiaceae bacterium]|nr:Crp/Fnr family transcriptional regulator [Clostridiaceae bacterium]
MDQHREQIAKNTLLRSLPRGEIEAYLRDGSFRIRSFGKNNTVHFASEVCSTLEIILSGHVAVERIDEAGNLLTIAEFISDDILGGNLLFSKTPHYPMTITAKQETVILSIEKDRLFGLFSDNHAFLRSYLEFVSDHTTILGDRIRHYVQRTIREIVLSYLETERRKQNSDRILLPISKKALAERIGVSRTSLSRELQKMREDGLILFDRDSITILEK